MDWSLNVVIEVSVRHTDATILNGKRFVSSSAMSMTETVKYLDNLDSAVTKANEALHNTVITSAGKINQNPNLDGFKLQIREVLKHFP